MRAVLKELLIDGGLNVLPISMKKSGEILSKLKEKRPYLGVDKWAEDIIASRPSLTEKLMSSLNSTAFG